MSKAAIADRAQAYRSGKPIADRLAFTDDVGEKFDIAFHTFEEINANGGRSCLD